MGRRAKRNQLAPAASAHDTAQTSSASSSGGAEMPSPIAGGGPGLMQVQRLARGGQVTPAQIATVIQSHPNETSAIAMFCHQHLGNAFVTAAFQMQTQSPETAPEPAEAAPAVDAAGPLPPAAEIDGGAVARDLITGGQRDENHLTNEVFWQRHPTLRGIKLSSGTPAAREWLRVRNEDVRPALEASQPVREHAAKTVHKPKAALPTAQEEEAATPTAAPQVVVKAETAAAVPREAPTPKQAEPLPASPAQAEVAASAPGQATQPLLATGMADASAMTERYYTQVGNTYKDSNGAWKNGSAAANTCNMTSLTMAMVSVAGDEKAVRDKICSVLREQGIHAGACAEVPGHKKPIPIKQIIDDPELCAAVKLEDLVTAAGIGKHRGYKGVTSGAAIERVAEAAGMEASQVWGSLKNPKERAKAKASLEQGKRIVAHTHNHFIFLVAVRDDGIVVHDPAGMRLAPANEPSFMGCGDAERRARQWAGKMRSPRLREMALRRASTNPSLLATLQQIAQIVDAKKGGGEDEIAAIKEQIQGHIETGAANFYSLADISEFDVTTRVEIEDKKENAPA